MYVLSMGQWRYVPKDLPPRRTARSVLGLGIDLTRSPNADPAFTKAA
jgi:hypothetical protein